MRPHAQWLALLLLALATFRAWRFIAKDELTRPLRRATVTGPADRGRWRPRAALFIDCPWCLGLWLSALAIACYAAFGLPAWAWWAVEVLSLSAVVGLLGERS